MANHATGSLTVAMGINTANNVSFTGTSNTLLGAQSAQNLTSGGDNTSIGQGSGGNATTGSNNIAIGHDAKLSSATASNEITLGDANVDLLRIPGLGTTDGHVLTFETASGGIVLKAAGGGGASSLNGLTDCSVTAEFSQFIGNVPSGVTSGNAFYNTSLGHNALESLTGGAYNTVIGFEAGDAITTNNRNTVFGAQALSSSNPANVTAIGYFSGNAASGSNAVYVGYLENKGEVELVEI